jgi:hypothetical protein
MLEHWHDFYLLVGTAASALLALLFVAVSIGAGVLSRDRSGPTRTYMSPVAFHFTAVLFISAVALVPVHTQTSLSLLLGGSAGIGALYAAFVTRRLLSDGIADVPDRLAYGLSPLIGYAAILAAAVLFYRGAERAMEILPCGVMVLLIINVRNAWDLLLSMARRLSQARQGGAGCPDPSAPPKPKLPFILLL